MSVDCRTLVCCFQLGTANLSFSRTKVLKIEHVEIEDTFAEAFTMRFARLIVTAIDSYWLRAGLNEFCGYGTSVIACDAEVGVEQYLDESQTIDGRPGAAVLLFAFNEDALGKALIARCGQCLMTCPTTAVFNGMESGIEPEIEPEAKTAVEAETLSSLPLGKHLRFFGDGFQKSKRIGDRRYWRIPVMDGEFLVEEACSVAKGVAGGNFLIQSVDQETGLAAARRAIESIDAFPGVITPFPGGVVRSGSKVGSKYKGMVASTFDQFCPTLKGRVESRVHEDANCVYEIVIDGIDSKHVSDAMAGGIKACVGEGVVVVSAGNYGGKLGKHHFHLRQILGNPKKDDKD